MNCFEFFNRMHVPRQNREAAETSKLRQVDFPSQWEMSAQTTSKEGDRRSFDIISLSFHRSFFTSTSCHFDRIESGWRYFNCISAEFTISLSCCMWSIYIPPFDTIICITNILPWIETIVFVWFVQSCKQILPNILAMKCKAVGVSQLNAQYMDNDCCLFR